METAAYLKGLVLAFLMFCLFTVKGQNISLNVTGNSTVVDDIIFDYSIGEMVLVETYTLNDFLFTQGFLQPYFFLSPTLPPSPTFTVKALNNLISPNGDGVNDFLKFQDIDKYPDNRLTIFDKTGRAVFVALNYKNDWNAYVNGRLLTEETYYYLLDLGTHGRLKGFVTVVHDKF